MQGKFAVLQLEEMNLLDIINKGSPKFSLNVLDRELFLFFLLHEIIISVKWDPRESNDFADDISKWLIPDDSFICRSFRI